MSYAIYKTEAIILRTIPSGEANKDVVFLTRDLGKITARAQSARKMESKMRMHLARYASVMIDVVRGKSIWRLTGITDSGKRNNLLDMGFVSAFARAAFLAEHLIRGEDAHGELFDFFKGILTMGGEWSAGGLSISTASNDQSCPPADLTTALELFLVIHVLTKLGYWSGELFPEIPTREILEKISQQKKQIVSSINESIEATQIS